MDSMGSNQVWTLVDPPKSVKPVAYKWVYKRKLGAKGEVIALKARLMEKGYTQRPRVDFEETYSPAAIAKSIQILLAITVWVSLLLEENRKSIVSKDLSMASNKLREVETHVLMKSYGVMISSRTSMSLVCIQEGDIKAWLSTHFSMKDIAIQEAVSKIDEELERMLDIPYASAIGSISAIGNIQYAVQCTRPDVGYALSVKSFVFKLNGRVVAWKSSKQATTTDSTTETKYIAVPEAAKEAVLMKNYIKDLGVVPCIAEPVIIFCDNNGTIAQAKKPRSHQRFKHILRRYHLLRVMVSKCDVRMDQVSSAENTVDPLTKPM
ncbi:Retrovirus-related Pol polyprotein from transposon RE2 [Sesamum angolense]|uniref:Retrovirus-related Pol polyprotein from transposon RE2 n=1 Tax=Sesamum angolense TaxID=2727404 RepID=A0AAE1W3K8_9LAMI|nr:Retrovirus-related Pol polyprotein from transposon RE2 [Sesamum angolense]